MRADQLAQELRAFQIQSELQYKYYEDMERKYRESRKILHDMKNHLQAVESLYREGAGSNADEESRGNRYVKDLYHMVNMLGEKFYSSNHMLNIICNDKLSAARRRGIRVVAEIGDVDFSDLKDIDITTIFANLLDNATDAAAESGQDRFIEMKIQEIQNFRVISIINSIPEQRLLTYEPDKADRSAQPDRQGRSIDADQQGIPAEHPVMHALAGGGTAYAVQQDRANRQKKKGIWGSGWRMSEGLWRFTMARFSVRKPAANIVSALCCRRRRSYDLRDNQSYHVCGNSRPGWNLSVGAGKAGVLVISGRYAVFCIDTAGCAASSAAVSEHPLGLVYAFALYRIFSLYGPSGNFGRIV